MSIKKSLVIAGVTALLAITPSLASAAPADIAAMATSAEGNILAVKKLIISLFYMIGVFLFGAGLFLIYKDQKQPNQGHAKNGAVSIFIGVALLLIPSLIGVAAGSIGADAGKAGGAVVSNTGF